MSVWRTVFKSLSDRVAERRASADGTDPPTPPPAPARRKQRDCQGYGRLGSALRHVVVLLLLLHFFFFFSFSFDLNLGLNLDLNLESIGSDRIGSDLLRGEGKFIVHYSLLDLLFSFFFCFFFG